MSTAKQKFIIIELVWLAGIVAVSIIAEVLFFYFLELNPILSVKIQGLIGLLFIAYCLRVSYRIWRRFKVNNSNGARD